MMWQNKSVGKSILYQAKSFNGDYLIGNYYSRSESNREFYCLFNPNNGPARVLAENRLTIEECKIIAMNDELEQSRQ